MTMMTISLIVQICQGMMIHNIRTMIFPSQILVTNALTF